MCNSPSISFVNKDIERRQDPRSDVLLGTSIWCLGVGKMEGWLVFSIC